MKVETYRCDNCDKARDKDANHWSAVVGISSDQVWSGPFECDIPKLNYRTYAHHACGDECRFALMTRYLATGRFERQPVADTIKAGR